MSQAFDTFERQAMQRALELAARGRTSTQPNPRVGCVILRDGRIVGEGWHRRAGEPHAEVHALGSAGEAARGASVVCTLEPCNHHGQTPPCSDALIRAGVARVVYAIDDPDPRVAGRGAQRLREAGIEVASGLLADQARELNIGFLARIQRSRPWLRLKLAASLDGRTALADGESRWITSEPARADVQLWRAESAAVLSSSATVLADDPALDVRVGEAPRRQPLRVILDSHLRTPASARLFSRAGEVAIYAPSGAAARAPAAAAALRAAGARVEEVVADAAGRPALAAVLAALATARINEVWVEAGATLAGALLDAGLVDELVLYLAPTLLGPDAHPLARLTAPQRLADRQDWRIVEIRQIGPDVRMILRP